MRKALCAGAVLAALAGCGGGAEDEQSAPAGGGGGKAERPTLNGCLELWANDGDAHVGSTAVREVAGHSTVYAKVEIRGGVCHVAYATKALTNFGAYVQSETSYGPFALEESDLSKARVRKIVRTANATAQSDGTLTPGPPR